MTAEEEEEEEEAEAAVGEATKIGFESVCSQHSISGVMLVGSGPAALLLEDAALEAAAAAAAEAIPPKNPTV